MTDDFSIAEAILADESKGIADDTRIKSRRNVPTQKSSPILVHGDPKRKVWVRCVTECQPWANDKPLGYWTEHEVSIEEAVLLESRKFAVILETPNKKG
jgi:hypothetical protein